MSKNENPNLIKMPVTYDDEYTDLVSGGEGITVDKGVISASGGSGGGMVVPVYTLDATGQAPEVESCDMTFDEIYEAIENKQCSYALISVNGVYSAIFLATAMNQENNKSIMWYGTTYALSGGSITVISASLLTHFPEDVGGDNYMYTLGTHSFN